MLAAELDAKAVIAKPRPQPAFGLRSVAAQKSRLIPHRRGFSVRQIVFQGRFSSRSRPFKNASSATFGLDRGERRITLDGIHSKLGDSLTETGL